MKKQLTSKQVTVCYEQQLKKQRTLVPKANLLKLIVCHKVNQKALWFC